MKKWLLALIMVLLAGSSAWAGGKQTVCNETNTDCATVTNHKLDINATVSGGAGGVGYIDGATYAVGSDSYTPIGGIFQNTVTSNPLTNGEAGIAQLTANRILMVNLRTAAGVDLSAQLQNIDTYTSRLLTTATRITPGSALATTSLVIGSRYVATPPTFTDGQEGAFQINSHGAMIVDDSGVVQHTVIDSGSSTVTVSNTNPSATATGTGVPANATYLGLNVGGNLNGVTGVSAGSQKLVTVGIFDSSGNQIDTFGGAGGTSMTDGAAFTQASDAITPIGALYSTTFTPPTDGHITVLRSDVNGFLLTSLGTTLQARLSLGLGYDTITGYCGVTTSKPTYSTGTNEPLSCTTTGALRTDLLSIDGVALLMGAGNTGTGSLRVTLASDNAPLTIRGANSNQAIFSTIGAFINMTTATTTQIVALSGSTVVYVTGYSAVGDGVTATTFKFVGGTGSNCGTGTHDLTSTLPFTTATQTLGISHGGTGPGVLFHNVAGEEVCVTSSGAANFGVDVSYAQF